MAGVIPGLRRPLPAHAAIGTAETPAAPMWGLTFFRGRKTRFIDVAKRTPPAVLQANAIRGLTRAAWRCIHGTRGGIVPSHDLLARPLLTAARSFVGGQT